MILKKESLDALDIIEKAAYSHQIDAMAFAGLTEKGELVGLEDNLLRPADPDTMEGFVDLGSALLALGHLVYTEEIGFKGLVFEEADGGLKLLNPEGDVSLFNQGDTETPDTAPNVDDTDGSSSNSTIVMEASETPKRSRVTGTDEIVSQDETIGETKEGKPLPKEADVKKTIENAKKSPMVQANGNGLDNGPCGNHQYYVTLPESQSQRQGQEGDKAVDFPSLMLESKPLPNKGIQYFSAWTPYSKEIDAKLGFKLTREGNVKLGKSDVFTLLRTFKDGEQNDWIAPQNADKYKKAGYRVGIAPKILGLERLVHNCDLGEFVFITDSPLDYYALNCALSCEWTVEQYKDTNNYDDYELGELLDTVGCAIMPMDNYEFEDRAANDPLRGKKVVVIDYGRNHIQVTRIAENLKMQNAAQSVQIWNPGIEIADPGIFKYFHFDKANTPEFINGCCDICHRLISTELTFNDCFASVEFKLDGGKYEAIKDDVEDSRWPLYPFVLEGCVNFIAGEGGVGKSQILTDWAVRLLRGENKIIPSSEKQDDYDGLKSLWITKEENLKSDVTPRFNEYGGIPEGNLSIYRLADPDLHFGDDMLESLLSGELTDFKPDIVFVDSLQAFVNGDTSNGGAATGTMTWLIKMCERYGLTFVIIHHFRKNCGWEDDFRSAFAGRHEFYDYARTVSVVIEDPERPGKAVVFMKKHNKLRGNDKPFNLIYEFGCKSGHGSVSTATLIDNTDERDEYHLKALMEAQRKRTREQIEKTLGKADHLVEKAESLIENNGFIPIRDFKADWSGKGYGKNVVASALSTISHRPEIKQMKMSNTIFFKEGNNLGVSGDAYVYVEKDNALDEPEGIAKLALDLESPISRTNLKDAVKPVRPSDTVIKRSIEILVNSYGFVDVDGLLYLSDAPNPLKSNSGIRPKEFQENIYPPCNPAHYDQP